LVVTTNIGDSLYLKELKCSYIDNKNDMINAKKKTTTKKTTKKPRKEREKQYCFNADEMRKCAFKVLVEAKYLGIDDGDVELDAALQDRNKWKACKCPLLLGDPKKTSEADMHDKLLRLTANIPRKPRKRPGQPPAADESAERRSKQKRTLQDLLQKYIKPR
jgi:hypothetical protein